MFRAALAVVFVLLALGPTAAVGGAQAAQAPPLPPARFYGAIVVDGAAPAPGTEVRAAINGTLCGQGVVQTIQGLGVGYVVDVLSAEQQAGCGTAGATVTFQWSGPEGQAALCVPTAPWDNSSFQRLDLGCLGSLNMVRGFNEICYRGATKALPEALTNIAPLVQAVFFFDAARQGWMWFFPEAGPDVNTLGQLVKGQIYWLLTAAAADWQPQP